METIYAAATIVFVVIHLAILARAPKGLNRYGEPLYDAKTLTNVAGRGFLYASIALSLISIIDVMIFDGANFVNKIWPFSGALILAHLLVHVLIPTKPPTQ